jgi:hypothetical protein
MAHGASPRTSVPSAPSRRVLAYTLCSRSGGRAARQPLAPNGPVLVGSGPRGRGLTDPPQSHGRAGPRSREPRNQPKTDGRAAPLPPARSVRSAYDRHVSPSRPTGNAPARQYRWYPYPGPRGGRLHGPQVARPHCDTMGHSRARPLQAHHSGSVSQPMAPRGSAQMAR